MGSSADAPQMHDLRRDSLQVPYINFANKSHNYVRCHYEYITLEAKLGRAWHHKNAKKIGFKSSFYLHKYIAYKPLARSVVAPVNVNCHASCPYSFEASTCHRLLSNFSTPKFQTSLEGLGKTLRTT